MNKEDFKKHALNIKKETGVFPLLTSWVVRNGYPCSFTTLLKNFDN